METLNTTEPHYIRCVKPNTVLQPGIFENFNVLNQLRCGVSLIFQIVSEIRDYSVNLRKFPSITFASQIFQGVLEAIRISCAGYPTKRTFEEFLDRFGMLAPDVLDGYNYSFLQENKNVF